MSLLNVNNIEVRYSDFILVIKGLSLEVRDGDIVSVLGNNGAGKTTMLKAISGLVKSEDGVVSDGSIEFLEKRIDRLPPEEIVKRGIFQVMEGRRVFEDFTVEENLRIASITLPLQTQFRTRSDMVFEYFPRLQAKRGALGGYLSGGEQQMLCIGRALMSGAILMLLDEPSMGLSPLLVKEIFTIIKKLNREENISMIVVEQNAKLALGICNYGYVMENGRIVLADTAEALNGNPDVKEFYLGLTTGGKRKNFRETKHYKRRKRWLG
ncbi:MAG: ABC transporter ATP-binding protein [Desulfobacteraceae bacterium]|jgi:branched-chain amino acid transport system ATP-binding protein|nr:MAG: ABC transporter ATP-binding protein [Desulfobacteraceae bacterium]